METQTDPFDDPALKAAVQRCFGKETAPHALRERITGIISSIDEEEPEPAPLRLTPPAAARRIWPTVLSLAAVLVVGIGIWAFQGWLAPERQLHAVLVDLIPIHDTSAGKLPQDMPTLPDAEYAAQAREVAAKVAGEILVATIQDDGWEFRSSRVQAINGQPSAQFIFHRIGGQAHISVFTLPASAWSGPANSDIYATSINGHCVAAVARNGQVYAMVGFCPRQNLQVSTVSSLLATHRTQTIPSLLALVGAGGADPNVR